MSKVEEETKAVKTEEKCDICGCDLYTGRNIYAKDTPEGLAHITKHHYVPERFFGRSKNRNKKDTERKAIFKSDKSKAEQAMANNCPWSEHEGKLLNLCFECHEELIHNPVFLPEDISRLRDLVVSRGFNETNDDKTRNKSKLTGRIELLQEVISVGLKTLEAKRAKRDSEFEQS